MASANGGGPRAPRLGGSLLGGAMYSEGIVSL